MILGVVKSLIWNRPNLIKIIIKLNSIRIHFLHFQIKLKTMESCTWKIDEWTIRLVEKVYTTISSWSLECLAIKANYYRLQFGKSKKITTSVDYSSHTPIIIMRRLYWVILWTREAKTTVLKITSQRPSRFLTTNMLSNLKDEKEWSLIISVF